MMELSIFTKVIYTTVQKELQKYFVSSMIYVVVRFLVFPILSLISGPANNSQSCFVSEILTNQCLASSMKYSCSLWKIPFNNIFRGYRTLQVQVIKVTTITSNQPQVIKVTSAANLIVKQTACEMWNLIRLFPHMVGTFISTQIQHG